MKRKTHSFHFVASMNGNAKITAQANARLRTAQHKIGFVVGQKWARGVRVRSLAKQYDGDCVRRINEILQNKNIYIYIILLCYEHMTADRFEMLLSVEILLWHSKQQHMQCRRIRHQAQTHFIRLSDSVGSKCRRQFAAAAIATRRQCIIVYFVPDDCRTDMKPTMIEIEIVQCVKHRYAQIANNSCKATALCDESFNQQQQQQKQQQL